MPYVVASIILGLLGIAWYFLFDYFSEANTKEKKEKRRRRTKRLLDNRPELNRRSQKILRKPKRYTVIDFQPNSEDKWFAAVNFNHWRVTNLKRSGQWARKGVQPGWKIIS